MVIRHGTVDWGWHSAGDNRTSYTASIFSRDGRCIVWTSGPTTTKPAKCNPYSRADVFRVLRERLATLRAGRKIAVTRYVHN